VHIDRSKSYRDLITVHVGGVRAARPLSSDDDPDEADAVRPCTAQFGVLLCFTKWDTSTLSSVPRMDYRTGHLSTTCLEIHI